jgi:hypothetical protein
MAMQIVNISTPDDGLGDPLRTGGDKINDNFTELDTTTVKVPEDYDPLGSGNFPTTYNGETLVSGDTFRITAADTLGAGTVVAPGDLIIALVSTPGQVDANWLHLVLNATHTGDVTGATALTIANDVVDNTKLANMPALTLKGNDTGGAADPQDLTPAEVRTLLNIADGANNYTHPNHTGDVTSVGDGAQTIQPDVVDNTKLANMPANTLKGNDTGGAADPQDLTPAEVRTLLDVYTTTQVDALIDASLKVPEAYDPAGSGNFPTTYDGNPVTKGDTFRIVTADTLGSGTVVNPEDLLIALVDTPGQTDSNWQVVESNRDQATETVKGVAEIATQVEVDTGTDDERIITPLKLANSVLASNVATNNAKVSFPEAPNDGQEYVRKNEAWAVNSGAGAATELDELSDVTTNFPVTPTEADDGKMLFYDFDLGQWTTDDTVTHGTSIINGKKASAGTILKGTPVYLVGFDADLHTVEAANATSAATMPVIGFAAEDLDDTNSKHIITFGKLTGVDTSSFSVGDDLYISTTTGQLTTTRPTGTALIQRVAKVLNSDVTGGQLLIYNTARTAGLPNLPQDNFWVGDANAEPQALTPAQVRTILNVADGANNYVHPNHTGDVTSVGDGAQTISNNAVTNAKLADMNANRLKGRNTAGVGDPEDLQISALTEELTPAAGDWLLGEDAAGNLIKVNVGNLPGGGGAVNSVTGGVNITNSGTAADPVLDHDAHTGDVTGATALTIAANAVDNSKLADMPALTIKGNDTGVSADPQDLTAAEVRTLLNVADGANNYVHPNHSGDVTSVADGATTIQPDVVDNTKLANMSANRLKGRSTAGVGDPEDLQISALTEELSPTSGDWLLGEDNLGNLIKINVGNLSLVV